MFQEDAAHAQLPANPVARSVDTRRGTRPSRVLWGGFDGNGRSSTPVMVPPHHRHGPPTHLMSARYTDCNRPRASANRICAWRSLARSKRG